MPHPHTQHDRDEPRDAPGNGCNAGTARQGGWLWVSAGVLAALTVVQGSQLLDRPAFAEMVARTGDYAILTTDGGSDEIVVVVDDRNEMLLVYRNENRQRLSLAEREPLPELFVRARARAGMPDRP